ncbi:hypothetical protein [Listeria fleischmannii]|uniref:Uncharacterized protein n=2 Tax=Listeria fleischmannii TaxID=1069827 RepID=A0A841YE30_9LIST|nr:hypothetical protein [Listeria fleischmannii]EIA19834.1 hypothetical protein KKC_10242 [Listeria fleischmannii subsp. coloradonensis]MBC1398408.1 hypothetical protein [Listeria fleischmannii]MBC1426469.1 hypothetical protein [Listeria fleischmannii]STY46617.1 Uncharacterised protein [Listeria fleischmannii subsp. coloradonensis]
MVKKITGVLLVFVAIFGVIGEVQNSGIYFPTYNLFEFSGRLTEVAGWINSILLILIGVIFFFNKKNHSFLMFLSLFLAAFSAIMGFVFASSYTSFHIRPFASVLALLIGLFYYTKWDDESL